MPQDRGYPVVLAETLQREDRPTVLVYGHYDVQPVGDADEWEHPPFEAQIWSGVLHGRGASDDKGQIFCHLVALAELLETEELPCNVKFLFEGEEEISSPNLPALLEAYKEDIGNVDVVLISDSPMAGLETPSISTDIRGVLDFDVVAHGANRALHSGMHGGHAPNPARALTKALTQMWDEEKNRVAVPGFYDDVQSFTEEERREKHRLAFKETEQRRDLGVIQLRAEEGYTAFETSTIRPCVDICKIETKGGGRIVPSQAKATISVRLVANQDPLDVWQKNAIISSGAYS